MVSDDPAIRSESKFSPIHVYIFYEPSAARQADFAGEFLKLSSDEV